MSLKPGTRLGPYEIVAAIGAGGMGEVYRATDTRLHRTVAIKILPNDKVADPERKRRFLLEARAASALSHSNIVTLFDIASDSGMDFLVMEYVAGKTLDKVITEGHGMPVPDAIRCAEQIASALTAAHAAGIVHRDLKPANVMLNESGQVKILDFGLAKLNRPEPPADQDTAGAVSEGAETISIQSPLSIEGSIVGTANYMSPEQAQGKRVDARSDIFSFGAVLYEMFSGSRAFAGETTVAVLAAILRDEVRPLRSMTPAVPPRMEYVIEKCLRKDPAERWQSMREVQVALASDAGMPIAAVPSQPVGPPRLIRYAGFWIRTAARTIDIILIAMALSVLRFLLPGLPLARDAAFSFFVGGCYELFFVSTRGATIGKVALNLKVVTADGSPMTRRLALGRYLAMAVSALTLIGFAMAGFDGQKRALHDRMCGTRVIDS